MRHKYLTMSPLFLGPLMNLNHLPWNILYPIRQNLLNAGHSHLIRVVVSELCHLTTSRNNKKSYIVHRKWGKSQHFVKLYPYISTFPWLFIVSSIDGTRSRRCFSFYFQNHHRRYNPFPGNRRPPLQVFRDFPLCSHELVNQMVSSFHEEDLK